MKRKRKGSEEKRGAGGVCFGKWPDGKRLASLAVLREKRLEEKNYRREKEEVSARGNEEVGMGVDGV